MHIKQTLRLITYRASLKKQSRQVSSAAIVIQARRPCQAVNYSAEKATNSDCIVYRDQSAADIQTIFKVSTKLRNDFRGEQFTVYKVGYP